MPHNARSLAVSFFRPHSSIVFFTSSSQVLTGRPTLLFPSTISLLHADIMSPSSFLSRCPNHLNLPLSALSSDCPHFTLSASFTLPITFLASFFDLSYFPFASLQGFLLLSTFPCFNFC